MKETLLSVLVGVMATIWVIKQVIPFVQWVKGEKKLVDTAQTDLHLAAEILLQKDLDGQNVFLGLPRMLREFNTSMKEFTGQMRQLVNHQSDTLKHLSERTEATQRILLKMKNSADTFQEEVRGSKG